MSFSGYYSADGTLQYCYNNNQYSWDPAAWGYYPGWTMIYTGSCGDDLGSELQWWQDTWYSWGMTFSGYYSADGTLQYCYNNNQYSFDPAAWGYYPGWTMIYTGSCGDESDSELQWW